MPLCLLNYFSFFLSLVPFRNFSRDNYQSQKVMMMKFMLFGAKRKMLLGALISKETQAPSDGKAR